MGSTVYLKIMILCYTRCPIIQIPNIIIAKLLPFPNKSKIINAIEYENPRGILLLWPLQKLQKIKGYSDYRTLIQCFAVFKEINSRWNYVSDPKTETILQPQESLSYFWEIVMIIPF
jgi:hypothetical protein